MIKLFDFKKEWDFGDDIYIRILKIKGIWLIQSHFYGMVYGRGYPYLSLIFGSGRLFAINFQVLQFGMTIELFSYCWFK